MSLPARSYIGHCRVAGHANGRKSLPSPNGMEVLHGRVECRIHIEGTSYEKGHRIYNLVVKSISHHLGSYRDSGESHFDEGTSL